MPPGRLELPPSRFVAGRSIRCARGALGRPGCAAWPLKRERASNPHEGVAPTLTNVYQFRHLSPVSPGGVEPPAPALSRRRSPAELQGHALLAAGQETRRHVLLVNVLIIALLSLGAGIWIGLHFGGHRATRKIRDFEHAERLKRAGLRQHLFW